MIKKTNNKILVISEFEEKSNLNSSHLINWNSYFFSRNDHIFSLPRIVDSDKANLKSKYLKLIFNLGELVINGSSIVSLLKIRPGLSYWWMTLISEKCNAIKSPQIDNAVKLMALQSWLINTNYTKILLKSSNSQLALSIEILSKNLEIDFEWIKLKKKSSKLGFIRRFYQKLPLTIQSLITLFKIIILRWPLKGEGVKNWKNSNASITIFSFLFNLSSQSVEKASFKSTHWGGLPEQFKLNNISTNWLHLYNPDKSLPSAKLAKNLIHKFNKNKSKKQLHVTLDSFWSFKVIITVLNDWIFLLKSNLKIKSHIIKESDFLWPIIKDDYNFSMVGPVSIDNLINLNLFQHALSCLPKQQKGFYLQENQGWEYGLINSWRESKHSSNLFAIPHSTIRYWDLRYFFDKRSYNVDNNRCSLPLPDYVGVNGESAKKMLRLAGYPNEKLIEVEALRYQYLDEVKNPKEKNNHNVLVLGGKNIKKQIKLLASSDSFLHESLKFIVKSDSWNPIKLNDYQKNRMTLTTETMPELLNKYNVVYTDNITSAAVDAYCAGKKVISMLDPNTLNLSPLLDFKDVLFVSSPEELAEALNDFSTITSTKRDFFYLDSSFSRWRNLINGETS